MHSSLTIFHADAHEIINTEFEIETLLNDCRFTEGPVWNDEGYYLFSDIAANVVYKLRPGEPKEVLIANSGTESLLDPDLKPDQIGSNGLAYDTKGTLLVCRHGSHMVSKWDGGALHPLVASYGEKPLNSPNDIVVDASNRVFFSDPPYGLAEGKLNAEKYQPLAAVYCHHDGETTLVCDRYQYPNGVCITPDGKRLYICSNKPFEKFISVYELDTLRYEKTLAEENSDGMKCDPQGNVFLSNKDGLLILDREGQRVALIALPTIPANHCFGGKDKKDLFITARENVFLIRNLLR